MRCSCLAAPASQVDPSLVLAPLTVCDMCCAAVAGCCRTPGFTGADLQNLMNEAAILAARRNLKEISKEEIADALERIIAGQAGRLCRCCRRCSCLCIRVISFSTPT